MAQDEDLQSILEKQSQKNNWDELGTKNLIENGDIPSSDQEALDSQPMDKNENAESSIDIDYLKQVLQEDLTNDIRDREDFGWKDKRLYDLKAYYGIKDEFMMNYPYPNASAYPVPITPVLLDTGHAMTMDLIWRNPSKVVIVSPISEEDIQRAKNKEAIINWDILNDIKNMKIEEYNASFKAMLHGTSYTKLIRTAQNKIGVHSINVENIYLPIDVKSPDIEDSDHVTHIIPLTANDMRIRIAQGIYKNMDKVGKGFVPGSTTAEELENLRDEITGLQKSDKITRDTYYIAETYKTFYNKGSLRAMELIIWWSPSTGEILRVIQNKENLRPFVDNYIYPNWGSSLHFSLPEIIKNIQEKANYIDKQATDATDKAISPAGFYEGTSGFDPNMSVRVPTGMYPVKNLGTIQWEPINIAPILAQRSEVKQLWLEAERRTGFTDLYQGVNTSNSANTLGQDQMRANRSDIRFAGSIVTIVNHNWKRKCELISKYEDMYMPKETKMKILGSRKFTDKELESSGNFDYSIANKTIGQQEMEDKMRSEFMDIVLSDPIFGQDKGNHYRALENKAEANKIIDIEMIVKRPKEANYLTPDEVINKLADGEDIKPEPSMSIDELGDCLLAIQIYQRTGNYKNLDPEIQAGFERYITLLNGNEQNPIGMIQAKTLAFEDQQRLESMKNIPPLPMGAGKTPIPSTAPAPENMGM